LSGTQCDIFGIGIFQSMDTTAEIVDVKWFGHDVIHSRFEASLLVLFKRHSCHCENASRCVRMIQVADCFGCFDTIHDRHIHIPAGQVEVELSVDHFDSLFSIVGQSHLAAELLQSQGADFPVHLDVFDKKNSGFSADMNDRSIGRNFFPVDRNFRIFVRLGNGFVIDGEKKRGSNSSCFEAIDANNDRTKLIIMFSLGRTSGILCVCEG